MQQNEDLTKVATESLPSKIGATAGLIATMVSGDDGRRRLDHAIRLMELNGHTESAEALQILNSLGEHYTDLREQLAQQVSA